MIDQVLPRKRLCENKFPQRCVMLGDNIRAVDIRLSEDDLRLLNEVSDPGVPYPKWMVLQLDTAEDPRSRILHPERYAEGAGWKDLRGTRWSGLQRWLCPSLAA
jgi:hypothetical protein